MPDRASARGLAVGLRHVLALTLSFLWLLWHAPWSHFSTAFGVESSGQRWTDGPTRAVKIKALAAQGERHIRLLAPLAFRLTRPLP
jgi:hypothetical protein